MSLLKIDMVYTKISKTEMQGFDQNHNLPIPPTLGEDLGSKLVDDLVVFLSRYGKSRIFAKSDPETVFTVLEYNTRSPFIVLYCEFFEKIIEAGEVDNLFDSITKVDNAAAIPLMFDGFISTKPADDPDFRPAPDRSFVCILNQGVRYLYTAESDYQLFD